MIYQALSSFHFFFNNPVSQNLTSETFENILAKNNRIFKLLYQTTNYIRSVLQRYKFLFQKWETPFSTVNYLVDDFSRFKTKIRMSSFLVIYLTLFRYYNKSMTIGLNLKDMGAVVI